MTPAPSELYLNGYLSITRPADDFQMTGNVALTTQQGCEPQRDKSNVMKALEVEKKSRVYLYMISESVLRKYEVRLGPSRDLQNISECDNYLRRCLPSKTFFKLPG